MLPHTFLARGAWTDYAQDMDGDPRWMTYRELATELGISLRAAEARAKRNVRMGRWRHRVDNEPPKAAQVLVPPGDLQAMRGGTDGDTRPRTDLDTVGGTDPREALVAELRRRAEAAEARAQQLAGEVAEQRERAGRAEGEAAALRDAVAHARAQAERADAAREAALARALAAEVAGIPGAGAWRALTALPGRLTALLRKP